MTADLKHTSFLPIAAEGLREIVISTILLGALATVAGWLFWPAAVPFVIVWLWVLSFFRDPRRVRDYAPGDLCASADGTVTEIAELPEYEGFDGPVIRIGLFLSLFNVHVNRSPCSGVVRRVTYKPGRFLDARHPDSGRLNESNTLLIDPDEPMPGPIEVRQVAGLVARRIICHAGESDQLDIGERFGMIKFGSRTELILPRIEGTGVLVRMGEKVRGGLTILARQPVTCAAANDSKTSKHANAGVAPVVTR